MFFDQSSFQTKQKKTWTPALIERVKDRVKANSKRSINKLAKEFSFSETSMRRLLKKDLGIKSRAIRTVNRVTQKQMSRLERCKKMQNWLKNSKNAGKVILFSDEKLFCLDPVLNRRNDRYLSDQKVENVPSHIKFVPKTKHSQKVMVLGVVGSDGKKCPIVFIDQNEKVNGEKYIQVMKDHVIPWIKANYPRDSYVWQQDGAPAHTAIRTQQILQKELDDVWTKDFWPPSSPDLNPLDYSIWAHLEREACPTTHPNLNSLKDSITRAWEEISEEYTVKTTKAFKGWIKKVIEENGDYNE